MLKKMLWFYLGFAAFGIVFYIPVGGLIGWMASEMGEGASMMLGALYFLLIVFLTSIFIPLLFDNFPIIKKEIPIFLTPYFFIIGVTIVSAFLTSADIFNFDLATLLSAFFTPFTPVGYTATMMSVYSDEAFFAIFVLFSAAHIAQICILMNREIEKNQSENSEKSEN